MPIGKYLSSADSCGIIGSNKLHRGWKLDEFGLASKASCEN
jgi:hypothetical protein